MLTNKDYCDYDTCVALKELGYNCSSDYTYVNNYRVRDEIYEKHPGLSDDGYLDLVDEYGGPYKRNEVFGNYLEPLKTWSRNSMLDEPFEVCSCMQLYEAQKWLREEKGIIVEPFFAYMDEKRDKYYSVQIVTDIRFDDENYTYECATMKFEESKGYEKALAEGIKEAVKILKGE